MIQKMIAWLCHMMRWSDWCYGFVTSLQDDSKDDSMAMSYDALVRLMLSFCNKFARWYKRWSHCYVIYVPNFREFVKRQVCPKCGWVAGGWFGEHKFVVKTFDEFSETWSEMLACWLWTITGLHQNDDKVTQARRRFVRNWGLVADCWTDAIFL